MVLYNWWFILDLETCNTFSKLKAILSNVDLLYIYAKGLQMPLITSN